MISKVKPVVDDSSERADWYETWFDSPYYHILYKNRDEKEAEHFLDKLIQFIKPPANARILDVACGKGRHSIYLNRKGYDVTGFDLSSESILYDKKFENETLSFYLHDMREIFRTNYFDVVLNLFSSFGYFRKERDNVRCLIANAAALKSEGIFVFDYFNSEFIRAHLTKTHDKEIGGIKFHIEKTIEGNIIRKKIQFSDKGKDYLFEENLLLAGYSEMKKYFLMAGLTITDCFGNYALEPFDEIRSERLILFAKKKPAN